MPNLPGQPGNYPLPGTASTLQHRITQLNRHITVCRQFIHANAITGLSTLVFFKSQGRGCTEILTLCGNDLPQELLFDFFHDLGERLIAERLKLEFELEKLTQE